MQRVGGRVEPDVQPESALRRGGLRARRGRWCRGCSPRASRSASRSIAPSMLPASPADGTGDSLRSRARATFTWSSDRSPRGRLDAPGAVRRAIAAVVGTVGSCCAAPAARRSAAALPRRPRTASHSPATRHRRLPPWPVVPAAPTSPTVPAAPLCVGCAMPTPSERRSEADRTASTTWPARCSEVRLAEVAGITAARCAALRSSRRVRPELSRGTPEPPRHVDGLADPDPRPTRPARSGGGDAVVEEADRRRRSPVGRAQVDAVERSVDAERLAQRRRARRSRRRRPAASRAPSARRRRAARAARSSTA